MHNLAERIVSCGPGGRKCACCNPFHGKSKKMMNRLTRRRLDKFFEQENRKTINEE